MSVESEDQIDEIMHSLPIWNLGYDYIIDMEWMVFRPYAKWAKQLEELSASENLAICPVSLEIGSDSATMR